MGEEALFQARKQDQGKLQTLGGVQAHQGHPAFGIVTVGITDQGGVVEELGQGLAPLLGVLGRVGEFLQVFNAGDGLRCAFVLQRFDVAGPVDKKADQFGKRRRIAGLAEAFIGRSVDCGYRRQLRLGGERCVFRVRVRFEIAEVETDIFPFACVRFQGFRAPAPRPGPAFQRSQG